jgi:hypothetical protein
MGSALKAVEGDREAMLALCQEMEGSVWTKDSGCRGWSVQDVVSHTACSFWLAVYPSRLPDPAEGCPLNGHRTCMSRHVDLPGVGRADCLRLSNATYTPDAICSPSH